jgi:transposase
LRDELSRIQPSQADTRILRQTKPNRAGNSLTPGIYFRALLIGYFEGMGAERGIAWRLADSLALRRFVGIALDEYTPDHSTISRTRRLIDLDTHREVFAWVLGVLADRGLLKGQRIAIDATTLEANAAMRSIVRLCGGTRARVTRSFCAGWRRPRGSKRRRAKTWRGWTVSARNARRITSNKEWKICVQLLALCSPTLQTPCKTFHPM